MSAKRIFAWVEGRAVFQRAIIGGFGYSSDWKPPRAARGAQPYPPATQVAEPARRYARGTPYVRV